MRTTRIHALTFALGWLAVGCTSERDPAPAIPSVDGGNGGGGVGGPVVGGGHGNEDDAGQEPTDAAADADTTLSSAFAFGECVDDEELPTLTNQVFMPADFVPNRGFAHWTGSCGDATLEIGLSEGRCPNGSGQELIIEIDADALTDGTLFIPGGNQLARERPDLPIRVRYNRPSALFPNGTWGTCQGVFGELIVESLGVARDSRLRADFGLTLAACDTATSPNTLAVTGSFDLILARGLRDLCPSM